MSSASKSRVVYIEPSAWDGKPSHTLSQLTVAVADAARLHDMTQYSGINNRPGAGRRKVKITITVEDAT